jgi:hypothetical protein
MKQRSDFLLNKNDNFLWNHKIVNKFICKVNHRNKEKQQKARKGSS